MNRLEGVYDRSYLDPVDVGRCRKCGGDCTVLSIGYTPNFGEYCYGKCYCCSVQGKPALIVDEAIENFQNGPLKKEPILCTPQFLITSDFKHWGAGDIVHV